MEMNSPEESDATQEFRARLDQSRDNAAHDLGQILEAYRPYLLGIANEEIDSDLRGKAGGSDLVQQTFLEANRDLATFRGVTEAELVAWLRKILLNNVANLRRQFRSKGKRDVQREVPINGVDSSVLPVGELRAHDGSPSKQVLANEEADAVELAIARLPEEYRQAIVLRHQQHHSFAEIGETMGRTADAARKLWVRAIEALQTELASSS